MTRADRSKRVAPASAGKYRTTARSFLKAAEDLATLAVGRADVSAAADAIT
ncbi:MAG: hypothetical protein V4558_05640 [Gemmatimonadota bacterium]